MPNFCDSLRYMKFRSKDKYKESFQTFQRK